MGRALLYSEDSESGEVLRKRFRASSREDDEELDVGAMRGKRKHKRWNDPEASSSYSSEVSARKTTLRKKRFRFECNHIYLYSTL